MKDIGIEEVDFWRRQVAAKRYYITLYKHELEKLEAKLEEVERRHHDGDDE